MPTVKTDKPAKRKPRAKKPARRTAPVKPTVKAAPETAKAPTPEQASTPSAPASAVAPPTPAAPQPITARQQKTETNQRAAAQSKNKAQVLMLADNALSQKLQGTTSAEALKGESFVDLLQLSIAASKHLPSILSAERAALKDMPLDDQEFADALAMDAGESAMHRILSRGKK